MVRSNRALIVEFLNRGMYKNATSYFVFMVFDVYYNLNKDDWWKPENKQYRDTVEQEFSSYFCKYKGLWDISTQKDKNAIALNVRNRAVSQGMNFEKITIDDWLKHIESLQS